MKSIHGRTQLISIIVAVYIALFVTMVAAQIEDASVTELVDDNRVFAFDLYQQINDEEVNLFYSPYSISQAMAMVYAGARKETEAQMADVLNFALPPNELHPAFQFVQEDLNSRNVDNENISEDQRFQLNVANALWGQINYPFWSDYIGLLDEYYGAGLQQVDFAADPEAAREEVNNWVAEQTEDRIQDIVPEGAINPATRLVLANAIYFNASWLTPFPEFLTTDAPFTLLDGTEVSTPMMQIQDGFRYVAGDGYQAVMIPYVGVDTGMIILLPDEGNFEEFEAGLDARTYREIVDSMAHEELYLVMPKLEFEYDLSLSGHLVEMGMEDAFDEGAANFSGMADLEEAGENLFISDVLHKAFIKVDETGTEAAAATVAIIEATSALPAEPIELRIDRPFIFTISDLNRCNVLFMGRVLDPTE